MKVEIPQPTRRERTNLQERALRVIEGMILATEAEDEMLQACYRFAHVGVGECGNPHANWQKEVNAMYRKLKRNGIL